jgi:hypothetical protein
VWHEPLRDGKLYALLQRIDEDLCEEVRRRGCSHCRDSSTRLTTRADRGVGRRTSRRATTRG